MKEHGRICPVVASRRLVLSHIASSLIVCKVDVNFGKKFAIIKWLMVYLNKQINTLIDWLKTSPLAR